MFYNRLIRFTMKKLPTLHIVNGDASVPAIKVADLPGQMLVWREILACGPAVYSMPKEAFWQLRQRYITETFQVTPEDYKEKLLNELPKLENANHFFEVVLWFDSDLVCQINLLYLLHQLGKNRPAVVSVCSSPDRAIGYKTHEEIQRLFEHRQMLEPYQIKEASKLWQLYACPDPEALQTHLNENEPYSEQLRKVLTLHLQQFPDQQTYLGKHQHLLLETIKNGAATIAEVQNMFWEHDPGYGFGDWQLQAFLKKMSPELVAINGSNIKLTEIGEQVVERKARFNKDLTYWLGGVQQKQQNPVWCWDLESAKIKLCADHSAAAE